MSQQPDGQTARVPTRSDLGPNDRVVLGRRVSPWLFGYGIFQGSVGSTDSLVLFYAAAGLGLSPALVGLVDATSSAALVVGALLLTFVLARIGNQRLVFALSMGGTGLVTAGFALAGNEPSILLMAMLFGLLLVAPTVLAPVLAYSSAPAALRNRAFSQVNRASASGSAAGIGAAALWIEGVGDPDSPATSMRVLFFVLGLVAIVGAVLSYRLLRTGSGRRRANDASMPMPYATQPLLPGVVPAGIHRRRSAPLLSDELVFFLLLSFVLFAGMGMSFAGVHSYLVTDLKAPLGLAMGAMFGFKVAMFYGAGRFASGRARMVPGQLLGLTGLSRAAAVLLMSTVGLLPPGLALPFAVAVVTLWGVAGGILAVTGAQLAAQIAVPGRWREAMAFYAAWTHAGAIAGAWLGGLITTEAGFTAMFIAAAVLIALASLRMMRL